MNQPFQWSDRFLLGYPAMDAIHREFVEVVAALQRASDAELPAALAAVAAHAIGHFEQEEGWMRSTNFPATQCHADEHAAVLGSVREVQAMLADPAQHPNAQRVTRELAVALVDWFPGHADYLDAALSHWMSKRSHGGAPVVLRRELGPSNAPAGPGDQADAFSQ